MRIYTEKETQEILRRAASLEKQQPISNGVGLTLHDLKRVATEVGLDPALVEQAARSLEVRPSSKREKGVFGAGYTLVVEHVLPRPLDDETWSIIVDEARRAFNVVGLESGRNSSRVWTHSLYGYMYQVVTADTRRGKTYLRAEYKMHNESTIWLIPFFLMLFAGLSAIPFFRGDAMWLFPLMSLLMVAGTALSRHYYAKMADGVEAKMHAMFSRVEGWLEEEAPAVAVRESAPAPSIPLPDAEAEEGTSLRDRGRVRE